MHTLTCCVSIVKSLHVTALPRCLCENWSSLANIATISTFCNCYFICSLCLTMAHNQPSTATGSGGEGPASGSAVSPPSGAVLGSVQYCTGRLVYTASARARIADLEALPSDTGRNDAVQLAVA